MLKNFASNFLKRKTIIQYFCGRSTKNFFLTRLTLTGCARRVKILPLYRHVSIDITRAYVIISQSSRRLDG
jgi:hypothetical protein